MSPAFNGSSLLACTVLLATAAWAHDGDPKLLHKKPAYQGTGWRNAQLSQATPGSTGGAPGMLLGPPIDFPRSGVTLLAWLSLADFGVPASGNGNSCTGYVSPSGREYAIMGLSTGTAFVEITQPANPVIVAQVAGPNSLWRDMRTYGNHCYAVSEGGSGIQVMSLANIDAGSVTLVNTINDDATGATHTIAIDTASGFLYRSGGGSNGLRIYNVGANAANPPRVGTWNTRYVHEPSIFTFTTGPAAGKQIAYCCGGLNGGFNSTGLYVVDVTNKAAPVQTAFVTYPNPGYAHQAWPSPDMQWLYLDDELDDQDLGINSTTRVFSLANPLVPVYVGSFTNGNTSTDHNLYTENDLIYSAAYRSGLRIYSTSSPGTPQVPIEIGYFDTWPEDDGNDFNGLWNNYPYLPSGIVIGSDLEKGFFVWWVGTPQLSFAIAGGPPANTSPAGQTLAVTVNGSVVAGTARIHVDTGSGFVASDMIAQGGTSYLAMLPPAPCGGAVRYFLSGQTANGITWTHPENAPDNFHAATAGFGTSVVSSQDFEASAGGFTAGAAGDNATAGVWTRVNPNGTSAQTEDDHTSSPGVQCWVTGNGTAGGGVGSADVDNGTTTLLSGTLALAGISGPRISYWRWYDNADGGATPNDTFRVDISNDNGTNWVNVETLGPSGPDTVGGWIRHELAVSDFVTPTNQVRLRFVASDTGTQGIVEAAIDDFRVDSTQCTGFTVFCPGDGSLTACPCGNDGATGHGCANSAFAGGALLAATGTPSVLSDNVSLSGTSLTGAACVFFQGDQAMSPVVVDDGLGCVGGSIVRLGTQAITTNAATFPAAGDPAVSVQGAVPPAGGTRYYQCFYRNAGAAFCPPATSNRTNGVAVTWGP